MKYANMSIFIKHWNQKAIEYLKTRGVSGEVAAKFGLGFAPDGFSNLLSQFENAATEEQLKKLREGT